MNVKYRSIEERIMANSVAQWNVELQSYCWIWVGTKIHAAHQDYGRIGVRVAGKNKNFLAHRFVFMRVKGEPIPAGYEVDHICRVGLCVAPDHLRAVTPKDNRAFRRPRGNCS